MVIEAFGEISEDYQELLQIMALTRLQQMEHQPGGRVGRRGQGSEKERIATTGGAERRREERGRGRHNWWPPGRGGEPTDSEPSGWTAKI